MEGETCRLGGYESKLLGYRTHLYELCKECGCYGDMDIAMFGMFSGGASCQRAPWAIRLLGRRGHATSIVTEGSSKFLALLKIAT